MRRLALCLVLSLACLLPLASAQAGGDPFTVSGIPVDATAASESQAQNIAINSGRARAWTELYHRLTKAADWSRQPVLDDTALQRLIRGYQIVNERRSTTRFVASMTYIFNADAVRRMFRTSNIAYADMQAHPIMIVPMSPGFGPHSAWTSIWANPKYARGSVPLVLPVGDAVDMSELSALNFTTASWQDVEPAASRVHASEAFLASASQGKGAIVVRLKRLGPGNTPPIPDVTTPIAPGIPGPKVYENAADAAAAAIVDVWKLRAAVDFSKRAKLIAEVHIDSLEAWSALLQKLGTIPTIMEVGVVAMDTGEARIAITYVGTSDQLHDLIAQSGFDLSNEDGTWWLNMQAAPQASTQ